MKLIKTKDKFILVNNEKPKSNDVVFINNETYTNEIRIYTTAYGSNNLKDCIKVLAVTHLKWKHNLPSIDFSLLSEEDYAELNIKELDELMFIKAFNELPEGKSVESNPRDTISKRSLRKEAFKYAKIGFQIAQSLNDKMFSLEEAFKIFEAGRNYQRGEHSEYHGGQEHNYPNSSKFIQSLQQTEWNVEVEMKRETLYTDDGLDYKGDLRPKITNNSIRIVKIL